LKKYSHVNQKALDQYNNFKNQREKLGKRFKELEESEKSIEEMKTELNNKKDETIIRTFKQVAAYFQEIFGNLTKNGNGSAQLILYEKDKVGSSSEEEVTSVRQFSGIGIRVSILGNAPVDQLSSLSGGQKTIVALSLIFAIQMCDAAPFYIFDEIDAALDPNYTEEVMNMIKKQSESAQFIITTHKKHMIPAGDKHYKIRYLENRVSKIVSVDAQEAAKYLHEEGFGDSVSAEERSGIRSPSPKEDKGEGGDKADEIVDEKVDDDKPDEKSEDL